MSVNIRLLPGLIQRQNKNVKWSVVFDPDDWCYIKMPRVREPLPLDLDDIERASAIMDELSQP